MNAFLAVARNEIVQLYRDMWYLLLMTVGGAGTLIIMAYTLSTDIDGVRTLVVDLDRDTYSRQFIQILVNDDLFTLEFVSNRLEAERALQAGLAKIAVIIPPNYSQRLQRGETARIQVLIDGSEPGVAQTAYNHLLALANNASQQMIGEKMTRRGLSVPSSLNFRPRMRYNADLKTIVSVMPGLMAIVLTVTAVGAAAAFARERERGNFELLISTPLGRLPLLLGRIFPYLLVGLFNTSLFTAIGTFAFGMPLRGNLSLLFGISLLYMFATTAAGVFIAQFLHTQHTAMITTFMLFGIAPTYLSDIFFPVKTMPTWLQQEAAAMPATHFTIIARGIILKGAGWDVWWPNALVLLMMGVVMSVLAYLRFQKRLG